MLETGAYVFTPAKKTVSLRIFFVMIALLSWLSTLVSWHSYNSGYKTGYIDGNTNGEKTYKYEQRESDKRTPCYTEYSR